MQNEAVMPDVTCISNLFILFGIIFTLPTNPAISKLRQFRSPRTACVLEETLKAGCPFYLVSMPQEVRFHMGGKRVTCSGLTHSREG